MVCKKCGTELKADDKFCKICGAAVEAEEIKQETDHAASAKVKSAAKQAVSAAINEVQASDTVGEFMIGSTGGMSAVSEVVSPIKTVCRYFKSMVSGIKNIFTGKNKKGFIVFIFTAVIWITLNVLSICGVNNGFLTVISTLTYANGGGAGRSILGVLGGLLGKTVFASSLIGIINGGAKYIGKGFKNSFDFTAFKNVKQLKFLLIGSGIALCLLKVFAGYISVTDIMAPIASILLVIQSAGNKSGFLYQFVLSLFRKNTNAEKAVTTVMTGLNSGFALGAVFAVIPRCGNIPLYLGIVLLVAGIVLSFVFKNGKAVKSK